MSSNLELKDLLVTICHCERCTGIRLCDVHDAQRLTMLDSGFWDGPRESLNYNGNGR